MQVLGRYRALLYHIVSVAVSAPRSGTVLVVDVDGKFDVTRLNCSVEELRHVWVVRAREGKEGIRQALEEGTRWLVYGEHGSKGRELVVRIVSGGGGEADVVGGWRGWLRVEREGKERAGFARGMSVEEALREREERRSVLEGMGWCAVCEEGSFRWKEEELLEGI